MTEMTEGKHRREFLVSQANGGRSWEQGTVKQGEVLVAGQVVAFDGDELVAYTAEADTAGDPLPAAGILDDNIDATDEAKPATYMARDGEVNLSELTYPDETTGGNEEANTVAALAAIGIIAR